VDVVFYVTTNNAINIDAFGGLVYWGLRWLKGALEVERLSIWELCEGTLQGGLPCLGPSRIRRKGSGDGHLFL
jgi:hypothetical protein